jgi:glycosyltransferase involved in cell wall biosynthesis
MSQSLAIGFPYAADRFGGSTASSLVLAHALKQQGHRIHILVHGEGGRTAREASSLGLAVTHLQPLAAVPGYARPDRFRIGQILTFSGSSAVIAELGLDIVHTNDIAMLRSWAIPAFATSTALVAHWRSNFRESWSVKAALRIARSVIAVSHYSFAKLPPWVREKATVEYNSFDIAFSAAERENARAEIRAKLGIPAASALIGVFGNHIARKRTHVLADIVAAVPATSDGRPVYGVACGARAEPYDEQIDEKIAQFALNDRFIRPGFVRPVEKWMAACDVVIAPATDEPLARNVLEAQALGVPVIVSTDGGLKELIGHGTNGLLCDPFDIDGWVASVRGVLDDRLLAGALTRNGLATVAELSPRRHAQRISAIYDGLVGPASRNEAA